MVQILGFKAFDYHTGKDILFIKVKFISKHLNEALAEPKAEIAEIKKAAKIDPDLL